MTISNAPTADSHRRITNYRPFVDVNGQQIAVAPVEDGCLSSGFGIRNGRPHKGIDLYHADPVKVFAAAKGTVREKLYRKDYGNMLVIEHGDRLFARYAHLEHFARGIQVGATVNVGQTIGFMGNTASYRIPRHLHYEVLTGDYGTAAGSFHLTPVDLFAKLP
ncbi:MAG: M23 family metallopeptidase [Pseudomonadota bacterium]